MNLLSTYDAPMGTRLEIDFAVRSEAGRKPENADACDAVVPERNQLHSKGIAACIADGVSSSEGGREAAELCVQGFLTDYYSTPDSWTVKTAGGRVLGSLNRWLCGQGRHLYESPRGMVTTFSALVLKSTTAHILHLGDSRIWLYRDGDLELLTEDHRVWVGNHQEFLARAMGADPHLEIDYRSLAAEVGDLFVFTTDGVHDFLTRKELRARLRAQSTQLQACANGIVEQALKNDSGDNVSCALLRIERLPDEQQSDLLQRVSELPFPPALEPGMTIDGYQILRELHASKRSEVFLALDTGSAEQVVLKTPSVNYRDDAEYIDAFLHEEWVARRARNAHLLKMIEPRRRRFLYNISEFVEGVSLAQWMQDQGPASLPQARGFAVQIVEGLRALHRLEMYHQDLKPANVLIDRHGTVKLIDFGSIRVAGEEETAAVGERHPQGTLNYAAPETLVGQPCTKQSDLFSLGVIVYELLTGALPYGDADTRRTRRPRYVPARRRDPRIPDWVDWALEKAVHPNPRRRQLALSELLHDLEKPNPGFRPPQHVPLAERHPLQLWRLLAALSLAGNLVLIYLLAAP